MVKTKVKKLMLQPPTKKQIQLSWRELENQEGAQRSKPEAPDPNTAGQLFLYPFDVKTYGIFTKQFLCHGEKRRARKDSHWLKNVLGQYGHHYCTEMVRSTRIGAPAQLFGAAAGPAHRFQSERMATGDLRAESCLWRLVALRVLEAANEAAQEH